MRVDFFHFTSKCLADPQLKNGFSDVGRQMVESRVIIVIINIKNFISEWQNYETKKWQISLNETINFLDNKGCICMLLNLKMRHKPNVNCWSSRLSKIATIVVIIRVKKLHDFYLVFDKILVKHNHYHHYCYILLWSLIWLFLLW